MINKASRGQSRNRWDKRQYATYLVALESQQAVDRCLGFWRSIGGLPSRLGYASSLRASVSSAPNSRSVGPADTTRSVPWTMYSR